MENPDKLRLSGPGCTGYTVASPILFSFFIATRFASRFQQLQKSS
jgi:hypothetical protein